TGAVSRARTVIRGSSVRRSHSRNGLNSVRFSRQSAKHPDEVGIYGLGHGFISFKQVVGRLVIELRVSAEKLEELLSRALESGLLHNAVHLGADTGHFLEANLVYLIGCQIGCGVAAHIVGIQFIAMWNLPDTNLIEAGRQIFIDEKLLELFVSRHHLLFDRLACFLRQLLLVCRRDFRRKMLKWFIEAALRGVRDNLFIDLRRQALHDDLGMYHALFYAFAHQGDGLIHENRKGAHARDPVLVVLFGFKAERVRELILSLNSTTLVQGNQKLTKFVAFYRAFVIFLEKIVIKLVSGIEVGAIHFLQVGQDFTVVGIAARISHQTFIGPAVIPAAIAQF